LVIKHSIKEKRLEIDNVKVSVEYLYKILGLIPGKLIFDRCMESEECQGALKIQANFESVYNEIVAREEVVVAKFKNFFMFIRNYYSGLICTACDINLNQYFYTKASEGDEYIGYEFKISNCFDIYKELTNLLPAISDMFFILNVVKIFKYSGSEYLQGLDLELDDVTELMNFTTSLSECSSLNEVQLLQNKHCKDLCSNSFNLVKFIDPLQVFAILQKSLYAFERILIDLQGAEEDVMQKEVKQLNFSNDMKIITYDKTDEELKESAVDFTWYYDQPDTAPFDLADSWIRYELEGIAPHKVPTTALITSLGIFIAIASLFL